MVGRMTISSTSTSTGCSIAKAIALAMLASMRWNLALPDFGLIGHFFFPLSASRRSFRSASSENGF
jgi:hypothetical protein